MTYGPTAINGFRDTSTPSNAFLSNACYPFKAFTLTARPGSPVAHLDGLSAPSADHFFQAAKTLDRRKAEALLKLGTANEARVEGRKLQLRRDWNRVKDRAMMEILRSKFSHPDLREWLLETGGAKINNLSTPLDNLHDVVWGICTCPRHQHTGQNRLGFALMNLRVTI